MTVGVERPSASVRAGRRRLVLDAARLAARRRLIALLRLVGLAALP
jgi:hypothetical protein